MSLKSKAKAAKTRAHKKLMATQEVQKLERNAERLKSMTGGFAIDKRQSKKEVQPVLYRNYQGFVEGSPDPVYVAKSVPQYTEDMALREQRAQAQIKERKKLVMPLFNKGGLQLPTEADLVASKRGELKRR